MSVSAAQPESSTTRPSPFATPQSVSHDGTSFLPEGAAYRVHGDQLYCRDDTDLSGICWMTGDVTGLVGARCFVSPLGVMPLVAILVSPAVSLATLAILRWLTSWQLGLSVIVIAAGAGLFTHGVLRSLRKNFRLHYGVSEAARKARMRETASRWGNLLWTAVCVVVAVQTLFVLNSNPVAESTTVMLFLGGIVAWVVGAVAIHLLLRPRFFRPHIERRPDGVFCVKGLTPEFLHAVNRLATGRPVEQRW